MECNKEEAFRAKEMAEDLMKKMDFTGARRLALKAQRLYGDLENISQMLIICDVHCAAAVKLFGNEMDWYGILQIEQTANEVTIKKQYRKFALLLHPDKNNFPGAEAAFKLIGEAQRTLLDRNKRSLHDMKRKASVSRPGPAPSYRPQQARNCYTYSAVQNNARNHFTTWRPEHPQPQQQGRAQSVASNDRPTFWTACPFCAMKYEYYRDVINRFILCQTCKRQFTAYEVSGSAQGAAPAGNSSQTAFSQPKQAPSQNASSVEQRYQETSRASSQRESENFRTTDCTVKVGTEKVDGKRKRKKMMESSESSDTERSSDSEDEIAVDENGDVQAGEDFGSCGEQHPRRSGRRKRDVSYKENLSDDDDDLAGHPKMSMENGDAEEEKVTERGKRADADSSKEKEAGTCSKGNLTNGKAGNEKANGKDKDRVGVSKRNCEDCANSKENFEGTDSKKNSNSGGTVQPEVYECPDADFNDFDKLREEGLFSVGQTWAVYDTADGMPRFYARIRRVFTPGFQVRITWFEPDPDDENEILWVEDEFPVSCGKFRNGGTEITEDRLMFSHLISWEKGSRRDTYKVVPRKGEIWALFKNWNFNWISDPDSHRKYEYEFVEIVSEYAEEAGISVACLYKVKGFASVFCRVVKKGTGTFQIPPGELYRFSHSVPSFKLTGNEREGVPKGSYELDPACLTANLEEIEVPVDELDPSSHISSSASKSEAIEILEPEFYNFDADKSEENFEVGQIWSLYNDEEGLPKYYARVQKIEPKPEFKVHISWLELCSLPDNIVPWSDKNMPSCCGVFKVKKGGSGVYSNLNTFSHQLRIKSAGKRNEYAIFPKSGDVWALYRNWSAELKCSDLKTCEYDVVEVLEQNESHIEVLLLERAVGFNSVFKISLKEGSPLRMQIPWRELLRFSHQVPAFRLTEERGGSLRGFLELDPAALPTYYFS